MDLFDELLVSAKELASALGKKAEEFADLSKIRMAIHDNEKEITQHYATIGKLYSDTLKNGTDTVNKCRTLIERIEALEIQNQELSVLLEERKNQGPTA